MVNALDTHRMLYRNAVLIAYDAANPTTRIDFFDGDTDIGTEVYTNENGYLFYESNGRQPVECLNVNGDAIIKVSLDGGDNFDITWKIYDDSSRYIEETDVRDMTYRGDDSTRKTWHPLQADCNLPDYLLKAEYRSGLWAEQEIAIGTGTALITAENWTNIITITNAAPDAIAITNSRLRAGQVITIIPKKTCTLSIITGPGGPVNHEVSEGTVYLLFNKYVTETTDAGLTLIPTTLIPTTLECETFIITVDDVYEKNGTLLFDIPYLSTNGSAPTMIIFNIVGANPSWAQKDLWIKFTDGVGYSYVNTLKVINSYYACQTTQACHRWRYSAYNTLTLDN